MAPRERDCDVTRELAALETDGVCEDSDGCPTFFARHRLTRGSQRACSGSSGIYAGMGQETGVATASRLRVVRSGLGRSPSLEETTTPAD